MSRKAAWNGDQGVGKGKGKLNADGSTGSQAAQAADAALAAPKSELFAFGDTFYFQSGVPGAFGPSLWEPCQVAIPGSGSGSKAQVSICCGLHFTLSLDKDGQVLQWGVDVDEVLRAPTRVAPHFFRGARVTQIACGRKHSLALTDTQEVYSWGLGSSGQLGHGDAPTIPLDHPLQINCLRDRHRDPPAAIYAGGNTSGIVTTRKALLLWGSNQFGQCASGTLRPVLKPRQVTSPALDGVKVRSVALSRQHAGLVTKKGQVFTWGATNYGRLGVSASELSLNSRLVLIPTAIEIPPVTQLVAGDFHMVALTKHHHVFTWGMGSNGQGGHGHFLHMRTPKRVEMLVGYKVDKVAAGSWHSLAITDTCDVYTWGCGAAGQLGHGKLRREVGENLFDGEYDINNPRWIQAVEGFDCLDAACGGAHTVLQLRMRSSSQILQRVTQSSLGSGSSGGGGGESSDGFRSPLPPPPPAHDRPRVAAVGGGGDEVGPQSAAINDGEDDGDHESGDDVELDDINFIFGLCRHGRVADVGELINAGYPVDTPHPTTGNTLAIVAAQEGQKKVLRMCLQAPGGAENLAAGHVNNRGLTAVDAAEAANHWKLANWLREKIDEWNEVVAAALEGGQHAAAWPAQTGADDAHAQGGGGGEEEEEEEDLEGNYEDYYEHDYEYDAAADAKQDPEAWAESEATGGADGEEVERRLDPSDGNAYTYDEFYAYYGADSADAYWEAAIPASEFVGSDADFGGVVEDDAAVVDVEFEHVGEGGEEVEGGRAGEHDDQEYEEGEMVGGVEGGEYEDFEEEEEGEDDDNDDGDESPDLAVGDI